MNQYQRLLERSERPRAELVDPAFYYLQELKYPLGRNGCMRVILAKAQDDNYRPKLRDILTRVLTLVFNVK